MTDPAVPSRTSAGTVFLVGAGPGDEGLLTVRGQQLLRQAGAILFDALVNPRLLDVAPAEAERLDVGKRAGNHKLSQDEIHQLLYDKAQQHRIVVRLKGGDPYLFGRGAEEVAYLAERGVPCIVVPGVPAGIAAPACAGIPVTYRGVASSVTFITGHEEPGRESSGLEAAALSRLIGVGGTVCFYMGVGRLPGIVAALLAEGTDKQMPSAAVQWGTLPTQRSVQAPLERIVEACKVAEIGAPAIIIIGRAAGVEAPGLDFFTSRPLFGRSILVTRTRQQASQLRERLEQLGAAVLEAPTIELAPPADWAPVDRTIRDIRNYDWLVLTSPNGVAALADRLAALELDARHLAGVQVAAIGDATDAALQQRLCLRADLLPARAVAESLAAEVLARQDVAGKRFLLLRADIARPDLPRLLEEAGATVDDLPIYHTRKAESLPESVPEALRRGEIDWITFTSSSTAANLVDLLGAGDRDHLRRVKRASIGPVTSRTLKDLDLPATVESGATGGIEGLIAAIVDYETQRPSNAQR